MSMEITDDFHNIRQYSVVNSATRMRPEEILLLLLYAMIEVGNGFKNAIMTASIARHIIFIFDFNNIKYEFTTPFLTLYEYSSNSRLLSQICIASILYGLT